MRIMPLPKQFLCSSFEIVKFRAVDEYQKNSKRRTLCIYGVNMHIYRGTLIVSLNSCMFPAWSCRYASKMLGQSLQYHAFIERKFRKACVLAPLTIDAQFLRLYKQLRSLILRTGQWDTAHTTQIKLSFWLNIYVLVVQDMNTPLSYY